MRFKKFLSGKEGKEEGLKNDSELKTMANSSVDNAERQQNIMLTQMQGLRNKFGVRGVTRGATLGLCVANMIGGGLAYTFGKREDQEE